MDLKSMLNGNDSAAQRPPPLHTSQSSFDIPSTPNKEPYTSRGNPYPALPHQTDSRSPSGTYFGIQSPHAIHLNSASTSAGTHSAYAQSPGAHSQNFASRDTPGSASSYINGIAASPSMPMHQPATPGGPHQYQNHTPGSVHSQSGQQSTYTQSQSPRGSAPPNNHAPLPPRQISPHIQVQHQPATPLGPPVNYSKVSPQTQRPPSQGVDQNYRRSSYGSVGSAQGKDHTHNQPPADQVRAQSVQKQTHPDIDRARDRDRSVSVSPKTIPRPSPYRQMSSTSTTSSHHLSNQLHQEHSSAQARPPLDRASEAMHPISTPKSSTTSADLDDRNRGLSGGPSSVPGAQVQYQVGALDVSSKRPPEHPVGNAPPQKLKRNASSLSDASNTTQQPRKRLRREEIPLWARSARPRVPRFGDGSKKARFAPVAPSSTQPTQRTTAAPTSNGHTTNSPQPNSNTTGDMKWEPTIANVVPEDDLSTGISRWIHSCIGNRVPPHGAVFEIEAKIGAIWDTQMGERIKLPVRSEAITAVGLPHVKFESSMDMEQHKQLNEYLNNLAQIAWNDPARESVRPRHLRQYDDFFELTPEGLSQLNPALMSGKSRRPRVRKTTDKETGQVREMIVKTRIDDLEVYNPVHDFDFRISISIESNWEGDPAWLTPIQNANARTRLKDRMSYRHGAIQVDLTQVSHEDSQRMEHELEVEVSVAMLQAELEKERAGLPSRFNDLVKSLVDNARLLCRHGSLYRSAHN